MNHIKKCAQCIYFTECVGYCTLHDRDVTRYNGCRDYQDKLEDYEDDYDRARRTLLDERRKNY